MRRAGQTMLKSTYATEGKVLGVCGGFQMLGQRIHDPEGVEGAGGSSDGLRLLDCETVLTAQKFLTNITATLSEENVQINGYEIHAGHTTGPAMDRPFMNIDTMTPPSHSPLGSTDGACSEDGQIRGTYLHGLFESSDATGALLRWAGATAAGEAFDYAAFRDSEIDRLADALDEHLNLDILLPLCGVNAREVPA